MRGAYSSECLRPLNHVSGVDHPGLSQLSRVLLLHSHNYTMLSVGLNLRGEVVVRRKCSRTQLLQFTENTQADLIGMEACAGAHFLGRALREQGHEVRIIRLSR